MGVFWASGRTSGRSLGQPLEAPGDDINQNCTTFGTSRPGEGTNCLGPKATCVGRHMWPRRAKLGSLHAIGLGLC